MRRSDCGLSGLSATHKVVRIEPFDHRVLVNAKQIHAVQMAAYAQEAALLGVVHFPPLDRTAQDIQSKVEQFYAALLGSNLLGVISVCSDEEPQAHNIASLVVAPENQRQGIAKLLVTAVVRQYGDRALTVQTGAKNVPALTLYAQFGFVEFRRWLAGREPLELVKLRRDRTGSA
jgi:GNAT superfamily N-acetyltransferase